MSNISYTLTELDFHANPYNPKSFTNKLIVTYMCNLLYYMGVVQADRRLEIVEEWLTTHIGKENFSFGFEDYGQHGEYVLYTRDPEDLLAFTIRFQGCNNG